jgi:hypothetical protein
MNFIKNLWNKVKSFFSNMFSRKAEAKIETVTTPAAVAPVAATPVESVTAEVAADDNTAKEARITELFNSIMGLAKFRNYSLTEAFHAAREGDEATLARIEHEMNIKKYKAPKHNRKAA